jgi:hypothetical protein
MTFFRHTLFSRSCVCVLCAHDLFRALRRYKLRGSLLEHGPQSAQMKRNSCWLGGWTQSGRTTKKKEQHVHRFSCATSFAAGCAAGSCGDGSSDPAGPRASLTANPEVVSCTASRTFFSGGVGKSRKLCECKRTPLCYPD